jgi:hypothetical protein
VDQTSTRKINNKSVFYQVFISASNSVKQFEMLMNNGIYDALSTISVKWHVKHRSIKF